MRKQQEARAIVSVSFSIPEKNHLQHLSKIVDILHKAKARDFNFIHLKSDRLDGFLKYDDKKQPEINPKKMVTIRESLTGYKV